MLKRLLLSVATLVSLVVLFAGTYLGDLGHFDKLSAAMTFMGGALSLAFLFTLIFTWEDDL